MGEDKRRTLCAKRRWRLASTTGALLSGHSRGPSRAREIWARRPSLGRRGWSTLRFDGRGGGQGSAFWRVACIRASRTSISHTVSGNSRSRTLAALARPSQRAHLAALRPPLLHRACCWSPACTPCRTRCRCCPRPLVCSRLPALGPAYLRRQHGAVDCREGRRSLFRRCGCGDGAPSAKIGTGIRHQTSGIRHQASGPRRACGALSRARVLYLLLLHVGSCCRRQVIFCPSAPSPSRESGRAKTRMRGEARPRFGRPDRSAAPHPAPGGGRMLSHVRRSTRHALLATAT